MVLQNIIARLLDQILPVGAVLAYGGATAPEGYAFADGQAVSRQCNPLLFSRYGTIYGAGDGETTFNLPDLRGRVVAAPTGATPVLPGATLGAAFGAETHTLTPGELPQDARAFMPRQTATIGTVPGGNSVQGLEDADQPDAELIVNGGGMAHNNTQPTFVLNYIIRLG